MIRYALKCANGHTFESWFKSAAAFDGLAASRHLECPVCGSNAVEKALMAPRIAPESEGAAPRQTSAAETAPQAPAMAAGPKLPAPVQEAMTRLHKAVEENSDYVGRSFASEARAIHDGTAPERAIHGEANAEEARALLRDGVPVLPLPFRDRRGTN